MVIKASTDNSSLAIKHPTEDSVGFEASFTETIRQEAGATVATGIVLLDTLVDEKFSTRTLQEGFITISGQESLDSIKLSATTSGFDLIGNEVKFAGQDAAGRVVASSARGSKSLEVSVKTSPGGENSTHWAGYLPGTVCADAWDNISGLLTSTSPDMKLWDTNGWNQDCWAYSLRPYLKNIVAKRSSSRMAGGRARMKITPRHLFGAKHYAWSVGQNLTWLKEDGTEVSAKILGRSFRDPDYAVYTLEEHDPDIDYARILPNDYGDYIDIFQNDPNFMSQAPVKKTGWLPLLHTNYNEFISLTFSRTHFLDPNNSIIQAYPEEGREILDTYTRESLSPRLFAGAPPTFHPASVGNTAYYYFQVLYLTSGNPVFTIIDGKMVILFAFLSNISGPSANASIISEMINAADDDAIARGNLSSRTNLTPTTIDLSGFTNIRPAPPRVLVFNSDIGFQFSQRDIDVEGVAISRTLNTPEEAIEVLASDSDKSATLAANGSIQLSFNGFGSSLVEGVHSIQNATVVLDNPGEDSGTITISNWNGVGDILFGIGPVNED